MKFVSKFFVSWFQHRSLSIRLTLGVLIAGAIVPILVFTAILGFRSALEQRNKIVIDMARQTTQFATMLERELFLAQQPLFALAGSEALERGDLTAFYARASELARQVGYNISLTDAAGQQILNTRLALGARLPIIPASINVAQAIAPGRAALSGVVLGSSDGKPAVLVSIPVTFAGNPDYSLHMNVMNAITSLMEQQRVTVGGVVAIIDNEKHVVARLPALEGAVGNMAVSEAVNAIARGGRGSFQGISRDGVRTHNTLVRMESTGWTVLIGLPETILRASIYNSLWNILATGLAAVAFSVFLTIMIGRRLAGWVSGLSQLAASLAQGHAISPRASSGIREIDEVGHAIVSASLALASRTAEREAALSLLRHEVADRERVEKQLLHAQKMEAVGRLTSGVAHDFNNILAVLIGSIEFVAERVAGDSESLVALSTGIEAAMLGSDLTGRLLAFSRQQPLEPVDIDINGILAPMATLLKRTLGGQIIVEVILYQELWTARADPSQVQDALLNLSINARDAMPAGGLLCIETSNVKVDQGQPEFGHELVPGDYVMMSVSDTGTGMSEEVRLRAFEPFFTTKESGRGSGLGLSMVYGFARQSAGFLRIDSTEGVGTSVRLYLPRSDSDIAPCAEPHDVLADFNIGGGGTVLVVDDFDAMRQVACRTLRGLGYVAVEACSAEQALAMLDEGLAIDLLFTDMVMPGGLSGRALADQAWERQPTLPVVLTSGYVDDEPASAPADAGLLTVLYKPYRRQELAAKIREALEGGRAGSGGGTLLAVLPP